MAPEDDGVSPVEGGDATVSGRSGAISSAAGDAVSPVAADDRCIGPWNGRRVFAVHWTFGTLLWSMLVFFFWFAVIWMFVGIFADILRRDMSGWAKAGWMVLIVLLPFIGMLIYLIARPASVDGDGRHVFTGYGTRDASSADQIAKAVQLHEQGKITSAEFERLKQQALSY
jgi:hypothetical protein